MTHRWTGLSLLALFLLGLWLRLPGLGTYLTPDERFWSQSTAQFLDALKGQDWPATITTGHPGVTVMWAGTGGVLLKWVVDPPAGMKTLSDLTAALAAEPNRLDTIPWLRLPVALATLGGVMLFFLLGRRLFGSAAGLLAAALLLLDPFFLAHSRVLHMDALLATTVTIAWLAILVGVAEQNRRLYVLGGVAAGLGFLTKTPALALGPPIVFLVVWSAWKRQSAVNDGRWRRFWRTITSAIIDCVWIGLPALAVVFLLWPAMWVAPLATLQRVWQFSTAIGGAGHELGNFWLGRPVDSPGLLFYPAVLLWRSTPVSLIGLVLAICLLASLFLRRRRTEIETAETTAPMSTVEPAYAKAGAAGRDAQRTAGDAAAVLGFIIWFGLFMSLGDKEFDRYLLPVFPAVDLLAAWGWVGVLWLLLRGRPWAAARATRLVLVFTAILIAAQAVSSVSNRPTYLTAYNPLLGGMRTASRVMLVGWGEGLEEAARFLNERSAGQPRRAAAWYGQNVFGPFFQGQSYDLYYDLPKAADLYANDVDYVVTYVNQRQRALLDTSVDSLLKEPIKTISRQGVTLAQVYTWPKPFNHTSDQVTAPGLRLLGWTVGVTDPTTGQMPVTLYWDAATLATATEPLTAVLVWIKDATGEVWTETLGTPQTGQTDLAPAWLDRQAVPQTLMLQLPTGLRAGTYGLDAAPEGGASLSLGAVDLPPTRFQGSSSRDTARLADEVVYGQAVQLMDYDLVQKENAVQLDLLWAALAAPPPDAKFFVHVTDGQDRIVAQSDGTLAALPGQASSDWQQGDLIRQRLRLSLPDGVQRQNYRIYVGLYRPDTGARLAATANGRPLSDGRYGLDAAATKP